MLIGGRCASHHGGAIRSIGRRLACSFVFIALAYRFYPEESVTVTLEQCIGPSGPTWTERSVPPKPHSIFYLGRYSMIADVSTAMHCYHSQPMSTFDREPHEKIAENNRTGRGTCNEGSQAPSSTGLPIS